MPRIDQDELDDLKSRTELSALFEKYGVKSRGTPSARWAVCCFHAEKTGSLKIDDRKGRYHCFGCGASGDHFTVLTELGGKTFMESVEALGGVRPILTAEERRVIEDRRQKQKEDDERAEKEAHLSSERLFDVGKAIAGTHAAEYFEIGRGLKVGKSWTFDLRFVPALTYKGFATPEADEEVELGSFPAFIAAIRHAGRELIGVHRTYLDPVEPKKLLPPGDQSRNKAKKVMGRQRGGLIWLSEPGPVLATGEGIETTRSWFARGTIEFDVAIAASVSLGNMSGGALGTVEHPKNPKLRIPNGNPDMERPGVILPDGVREVILLGDGDSEPYTTRARLLVAARRFKKLDRVVSVAMAPDKMDFNDVLLAENP